MLVLLLQNVSLLYQYYKLKLNKTKINNSMLNSSGNRFKNHFISVKLNIQVIRNVYVSRAQVIVRKYFFHRDLSYCIHFILNINLNSFHLKTHIFIHILYTFKILVWNCYNEVLSSHLKFKKNRNNEKK